MIHFRKSIGWITVIYVCSKMTNPNNLSMFMLKTWFELFPIIPLNLGSRLSESVKVQFFSVTWASLVWGVTAQRHHCLNMILKDFFVLSLVSTLSLVTTSQPTPEGRDPEITKFHVTSKIQLRYASTEVLSHMSNPSSEVQEVTFEIRLPEKAFIHAFSMMVTTHKCNIGQILLWR